jgi:hypothetical protein
MVLVRLLEGALVGSEIVKHKACYVATADSVLLSFFSLRCGLCPTFFLRVADSTLHIAAFHIIIITGLKHMSMSG